MNTRFAWLRAIWDALAGWLGRGAKAAERKKERRQETDQRLRSAARRQSIEDDRKQT